MPNTIKRLQQTLHAIKNDILRNENIKKLLMHSTPNALDLENVSRQAAEKSVLMVPYINSEDPNLELNMNTFIAIYATRLMYRNDTLIYITTSIYTNSDLYLLDNSKFRLYEIGGEIQQTLENSKLNLSGKMILEEAEFVSLDDTKKLGLVLSWVVVDA